MADMKTMAQETADPESGSTLLPVFFAEDDPTSFAILAGQLRKWGFKTSSATNGRAAWEALQQEDAPKLVILDWMMPEMDGLDVCRKMRADSRFDSHYILMLTAREGFDNIVEGLAAGANDYMVKPFNAHELRARIDVGQRIITLQTELGEKITALNKALDEVHQLSGLLPICSYCKKIRDDNDYWQQIEGYIQSHSEASFSHGICPSCYEEHIVPQLAQGRK